MDSSHLNLIKTLGGDGFPNVKNFESLVMQVDDYRMLAKIFLLEGVPSVLSSNPIIYTVFKEEIANKFDVDSSDVCIVGSARLGYSPSFRKYGDPFSKVSDIDVVIVFGTLV